MSACSFVALSPAAYGSVTTVTSFPRNRKAERPKYVISKTTPNQGQEIGGGNFGSAHDQFTTLTGGCGAGMRHNHAVTTEREDGEQWQQK
jgi:hypothetical protein